MDEGSQARELKISRKRIQQHVANYFRDLSDWRRSRADEYPEDPRNAQSAEGLNELAEYVLRLPPSDERLVELTALGTSGGVFRPRPGAPAATAVARFRFDDPNEPCDGFLTTLEKLLREDARRFSEEHGV
jgi:hypothetical protein